MAQAFFTALTGGSYFDWMGEYDTAGQSGGTNQHLNRGSFLKAVQITPSVMSNPLADSQIGPELQAQITAGNLPTPKVDSEGVRRQSVRHLLSGRHRRQRSEWNSFLQ